MEASRNLLEDVTLMINDCDLKCEIIESPYIKGGKPVISIFNSDYYITVKPKKNSRNIYFLYEYNENNKVKNTWIMGSIYLLDVIKKIKELKNN